MLKKVILLIFVCLFTKNAFPQTIDLEPIIVNYESFRYRSVNSLSNEYLDSLPVHSLDEAVKFVPGVELKRRNSFGIQQDISIRGSSFEDVGIFLEGIKINDPQTGHFSMEIPLTLYDLQKVEVNKGAHTVDYRLKKPAGQGMSIRSSFGEHALWTQTGSFNFGNDVMKNRISVDHRSSSGGSPDTDFDTYNFSMYSVLGEPENELSFLFADQEKDFGASTFYSINFPQQAEKTSQRFFLLSHQLQEEKYRLKNAVYFRRHYDRFLLNRYNPAFYENQHTSYVYGGKSSFELYDFFDIYADIGKEKVTSTSLGNHSRVYKNAGIELHPKISDVFFMEGGGKFVHTQSSGADMEWDMKLGFTPHDDLEIDFIYHRLIRTPSFTELFYVSPANIGDSTLDVEKIDNFEVMMSFSLDPVKLHTGVFLKKYSDTIDWVKNSSGDPWRVRNIGDNTLKGIECGILWPIDQAIVRSISTNYMYLRSSPNQYAFSKYFFDYDQHRLNWNLQLKLLSFDVNMYVYLVEPQQRSNYVTGDIKVLKDINDHFTVFLEGTNVFNRSYYELTDVQAQGRWWRAGVEYTF